MKIGMILGMVLAVLAPALASAQSVSSALSVYNLQTAPNPVVAGGSVMLSLQLYDSYSSTLQNVNLQLEGSYPILNFSPVSSYIISSMSQGLYGGNGSYFTYNIHIPASTPSGTYTLDLVANYETVVTASGQSETITGQSVMPISFYVNGAPNLTVSAQSSGITPGTNTTLRLTLLNSGYGTADNVTANLLSTPQFRAQGTTRYQIGTLAEGASTQINAVYQVNPRLANGTYEVPLTISYYSLTGYKYVENVSEQLGLAVSNPEVVVNITSAVPSALYKGYNQTLVLSVSNVGSGTAKNVSIDIKPSAGIEVLSSVSKFFIGSMAAGGSTTETLLVAANNNTGTNASLTADVDYSSQNYETQFAQVERLNLSVASSSTFSISTGNYSLAPSSTNMPVQFVITNTGNIDAQNVQVTFQSSYPVTPVTSTYYIANLEPGQSTTVSFTASVDANGAPGSYPVTIYETWRQPNGAVEQQYSGSNAYYVTVSSNSSGFSGPIVYVVVAVVIVIVAVFVVRRRMAAKNGKGNGKKK